MNATIKPLIPDNYAFGRETVTADIRFLVRTDVNATPALIRALPGFPQYGSPSPLNDGLVCKSVSIKTYDAKTYIATAHFEMPTDWVAYSENGDLESPWNRAPEISIDSVPKQEVQYECYTEDDRGRDTENTIRLPTGELFDTPPMRDVYCWNISIRWSARATSEKTISAYRGTINRSPVVIDRITYPIQTLLMRDFTCFSARTPSGRAYWNFEARIEYDPRGHNYRPLLAGWKAIFGTGDNAAAKPVFIDRDGNFTDSNMGTTPISEPVLLQNTGKLLSKNQSAMRNNKAHCGNFRVYHLADWEKLKIPAVGAAKKTKSS